MIPEGTPEALRAELEQAFRAIEGNEGDAMREKCRYLSEVMRGKRKGEWDDAVRAFGRWGREQ